MKLERTLSARDYPIPTNERLYGIQRRPSEILNPTIAETVNEQKPAWIEKQIPQFSVSQSRKVLKLKKIPKDCQNVCLSRPCSQICFWSRYEIVVFGLQSPFRQVANVKLCGQLENVQHVGVTSELICSTRTKNRGMISTLVVQKLNGKEMFRQSLDRCEVKALTLLEGERNLTVAIARHHFVAGGYEGHVMRFEFAVFEDMLKVVRNDVYNVPDLDFAKYLVMSEDGRRLGAVTGRRNAFLLWDCHKLTENLDEPFQYRRGCYTTVCTSRLRRPG